MGGVLERALIKAAACENASRTNKASSKRIAMLAGAFSMALAVVILAAAGFIGHDVSLALGAVCVPLAGLGGYSYVRGKVAERQPHD